MAGEGRRFYGRTMPSATPNRHAMTIRQPLGVAGLIIAANTPIANVAWKVFPALLCGNAAVLKASEDTPETPVLFARLAAEAGLPAGVLNVVQGFGDGGRPAARRGSARRRRLVHRLDRSRPADRASRPESGSPRSASSSAARTRSSSATTPTWSRRRTTAALSAFSNAGQRCAAGSRLIVFDAVYDRFRELLLERTRAQRVGSTDEHDFGPVINERQLQNMLDAVERARAAGATVLTGGERLTGRDYDGGFYIGPTIVEDVAAGRRALHARSSSARSRPCIASPTSRRRSRSRMRAPTGSPRRSGRRASTAANEFVSRIVAGGVQVNGPTYGFEPHVPFGGQRDSGTGWREPGTEALDVYSDWKTVYVTHDPTAV